LGEAEKNEYDQQAVQMFPDIRPSNFTWNEETGHHMWTTFMSSQWDLNYANPKTLIAMAGELMFLLNQGAEILRLDAVAWLWKEKGTKCADLPETRTILKVFNAMSRIAAPGCVFLAEQIDAPETLKQNLGVDKCQMAYNTVPLIHMWDALAHQDASFMAEVLRRHANTPDGTALLNMVRTHDDIGFCFDQASAEKLGIDMPQRDRALEDFYVGGGSYAKGLPFQEAVPHRHDGFTGRRRGSRRSPRPATGRSGHPASQAAERRAAQPPRRAHAQPDGRR
jgi:amylosucrase